MTIGRRLAAVLLLAGLGLLGLLGLGGLAWYGARPPVEAPPAAGQLEVVEETTLWPLAGAVLVQPAGGAWAPAVAGQPLGTGDAVRTTAGAHALVAFFEGSTAAVEPNSELLVGRIDQDAGALRVGIRTRLTVGGAWFRVPAALDPESRFEVETPAAVAMTTAGPASLPPSWASEWGPTGRRPSPSAPARPS